MVCAACLYNIGVLDRVDNKQYYLRIFCKRDVLKRVSYFVLAYEDVVFITR